MMEKKGHKYGFYRKPLPLAGLVVILVGLSLWGLGFFRVNDTAVGNTPVFAVKRGFLRISVSETGSIQARESIIVKSEVEGTTSIIYLVDEGSRVKKGDLLVELDASKLLDEKVDQEIKVQNAEAAFVSARENLAVVENQAQSDVDKAQLTYDFAVQDLDKYIKGEYPNQLKEAESKITLAQEEVTRAQEKLEWSRKLYNEKYISQTELQADELAAKKTALDLELVRNDLELLENYTHKRRLMQLESDVKQAQMALDRAKRKAKADVVQAKASLTAREAEFKQQQDKLKKTEIQIEKTKIYAPADGLVIYATSASRGGPPHMRTTEPLDEGQMVRERQDLIYLPTSLGYNCEIGVSEASLDKVRLGLPAVVKVEAVPGETYTGRVTFIAPLPDAQSAFLNPDLKIYNTVIQLEDNGKLDLLRAGMNCTADIIVKQYDDAIYIPIQAVLRVGGRPTVYVMDNKDFEPRPVEIGLDNNRMVRIISGLEQGEMVSLAPPLAQAAVEERGEKTSSEFPPGPEDNGKKADVSSGTQGIMGQGSRVGFKQDGDTESGLARSAEGGYSGRRPKTGGNFILRFDKDSDGQVSKAEFTGPDQLFQRLDRDHDGFITKGEVPTGARPSNGFQGIGPSQGGRSPRSYSDSGGN